MTFEGLGEVIEGYSADTGAGKFPLVSMGGRADVSEKTPLEFSPIIFPVSQDHQEDHQQNHLLYQKAEVPGSTRAAEGPTDKAGEPAAKEAEVPTARAFKEPTTEARLH